MNFEHVYTVIKYRCRYLGIAIEAARCFTFSVLACLTISIVHVMINSRWMDLWITYGIICVTGAICLFVSSFITYVKVYNELYSIAKSDDNIKERLQEHPEINDSDYYRWVTMEAFTKLSKETDVELFKRYPELKKLHQITDMWWVSILVVTIGEVMLHMMTI